MIYSHACCCAAAQLCCCAAAQLCPALWSQNPEQHMLCAVRAHIQRTCSETLLGACWRFLRLSSAGNYHM